jgi:hypothetical protein
VFSLTVHIKKITLLLDVDFDLFEWDHKKITNTDINKSAFDIIYDKNKYKSISKETFNILLSTIKDKKPEQYQKYLIIQNTNKYNI